MIDTPAPVFGSLYDRIGAALVALALGLASVCAPTSSVATTSPTGHTAVAWERTASTVTLGDDGCATSLATHDADLASCRVALEEVTIATRLLTALREDRSPEFDAYLGALETALGPMPEQLDVASTAALTNTLQFARARLVADASSYRRWSRVVRAIDPGATEMLRVPERFVVRLAPTPERPIVIDESDVRVDRAVREFFGV